MHRTKALFVAALTIVASACAQPDRPTNERGGVDFSLEDAREGVEFGPLDSCTECCEDDAHPPWCDDGGYGSGGGTGGGSGLPTPAPGCGQSCHWDWGVSTWVCYDHCPGGGGEGHWP